jgi:hypothetical protein
MDVQARVWSVGLLRRALASRQFCTRGGGWRRALLVVFRILRIGRFEPSCHKSLPFCTLRTQNNFAQRLKLDF